MFLYLSKKISVPNGSRVKSLAWNSQQGWLACGGENGLLKVLKLKSGRTPEEKKPTSYGESASNLSMNQTLEGHQGTVAAVSWNQNYRKLTTCDEKGLVIVWVIFKEMWFEEMINNRNKSVVRDLRWSSDGQKICIVYEDGLVIVGNVDGNRLWAKELHAQLSHVEWSPDARLILLSTMQGTCLIYDDHGNYVCQLLICFVTAGIYAPIVGIDWYNGSEGHSNCNAPTLAVALETGNLQLMRYEADEDAVLVDMQMKTTCIKWNCNGEVLAAIGSKGSETSEDSRSTIQLYSNFGTHLRTLHVPGTVTSALSWEGGGLRLAMAVDTYIYLANVRPQYKWAFFGNSTCVYAFRKRDHSEHSVMFWDINTNERYCKYVSHLLAVTAVGEHCILATEGEEAGKNLLILCNVIGTPIDSKSVAVEPLFMAMNSSHSFMASKDSIYVWGYKESSEIQLFQFEDDGPPSENSFDVNDPEISTDQGREDSSNDGLDHICCICCSEKYLIVGRESGIMHCHNLSELPLESRHLLLDNRPQVFELNCSSSRLSVIDVNGALALYDLMQTEGPDEACITIARVPAFERQDVWSTKWADDNPDLLAIMERTRMYIFRGTEPEEPVSCSAYLCKFHNLQIHAVQLDEVMSQPEQPGKDHVFNYETKSLRDTQQMLQAVEIQDAFSYVEEHAHPRLWMSLAEHALEKVNLSIAEKESPQKHPLKEMWSGCMLVLSPGVRLVIHSSVEGLAQAFVRCQHYCDIQFVKGLHALKDRDKQLAEICVHFERFDAAQEMYTEMDRQDLAIDMRMKMGDWFEVESLILDSGMGNDSLLELIWNNIGNHYADRQNWSKAAVYYGKANNYEKCADCFYALESWSDLETLMKTLHPGSPLLLKVAKMFASVGVADCAVTGFLQGCDEKSALDCCVELNHWSKVVELSGTQESAKSVAAMVSKYTNFLLRSGKPLQAVEVYDKVGEHHPTAIILQSLAMQLSKKRQSPLDVKKIFVLAALQAESHRLSLKGLQVPQARIDASKTFASATLDGLLQHDQAETSDNSLKRAWHGAEAYHLWLLAHRELYAFRFEQALKAAWWLRNYDDVLYEQDIYSLIALAAFYSKQFYRCNVAFVRLKSLEEIPQSKRDVIADLALKIFTRYSPLAPEEWSSTRHCPDCGAQVQELEPKCSTPSCSAVFPICMASGSLIVDEDKVQCTVCRCWLMVSNIKEKKYCPFCHSPLRLLRPQV